MILGYDTETTGLPLWHDPSDHPDQPHPIRRWANIIKPGDGAVMAPEAFEAHGISLERARDEGVDPIEALDAFLEMVGQAKLMVGHNESFDRRIMRIHSARHRGIKWEPPIPSFCTLYKSKYILRLPATEKMVAAGIPGPKSPNLGECVRHFFDEDLVGAHDALADVEACMRVFWCLVRKHGVPMFKPEKAARPSPPIAQPVAARPAPQPSVPVASAPAVPDVNPFLKVEKAA